MDEQDSTKVKFLQENSMKSNDSENLMSFSDYER